MRHRDGCRHQRCLDALQKALTIYMHAHASKSSYRELEVVGRAGSACMAHSKPQSHAQHQRDWPRQPKSERTKECPESATGQAPERPSLSAYETGEDADLHIQTRTGSFPSGLRPAQANNVCPCMSVIRKKITHRQRHSPAQPEKNRLLPASTASSTTCCSGSSGGRGSCKQHAFSPCCTHHADRASHSMPRDMPAIGRL